MGIPIQLWRCRIGSFVQPDKSKTSIRTLKFSGTNEKWFYQGQRVEIVASYKYMGLMFTLKLVWTKAKEDAQAKRALFTLYNVQNKLGTFSVNEAFKLFDTMILTYAAQIWGYEYSVQIEKVHDRFCAQFLQLPRYTYSVLSRGEVGRLPLCYNYYVKVLKY